MIPRTQASERRTSGRWPRILLVLTGCLALLPQAERAAAAPWPAGPQDEALDDPDGQGDDLRETIEIYMLARMKHALELTPGQEEKLVPLVQSLSAARNDFRKERRLSLMRLRPMAEDPATSEGALETELKKLRESEDAFRDEEQRQMDRIRDILSTRQEARFVIFIDQFMNDMQRRLRQMRQLHGGPGQGPGGPGLRRRGGNPPGGF